MTTEERRGNIARLLLDKGQLRVGELAKHFGVSSETVRKDLIALDKQGLAKKSHGFAVAPGTRQGLASAEGALCIIEKALEYIPTEGALLLGGGALCILLAQRLPCLSSLCVITDSLNIARVCWEQSIKTSILGGELLPATQSVSGLWATDCLSKLNANAAFLCSGGFIGRNGPCTDSFSQALTAHAMLGAADWRCVLADGSQMQEPALLEYASWEEIDLLISDSGIQAETLETLQGRVEIQLAY